MPRILPLLLVLAALGLVAPAGALADGGLALNGNQLVFTSDINTAANLVITRQTTAFECGSGAIPCIQFADSQDVRDQVAGTGCVQVIPNVAACNPAVFTNIRLDLRDADDFAVVGAGVAPTTMDGGTGDDHLSSDNGADTLLGGPDDDQLSDSDDDAGGADLIDGGAGDDDIFLGAGDDTVIGGTGTDLARLGSGDDTVRLDDVANDGRAGEKKNLRTDLEVVDGGFGGDTLFGNAAGNALRGGPGNDLLDGGAGADTLEGGPGADDLAGGAGTDRVTYPEAAAQRISLDGVRDDGVPGELDNVRADIEDVAAGDGNDEIIGNDADNVLDGGAGDDRIDGGAGVDTLLGGAGADALFARDGLKEHLDCGPQADAGEADTIDELVGCEGVALSADRIPDADGDGVTKPGDCDDGNPAIRPGVIDIPENGIDEDCNGADAVNLDRDRDGFLRPSDCDDANPLIHPGTRDVPGNRIDEDCLGGPAPFPLLGSLPTGIFEFPSALTRVVAINIRQPRKGSTLRISCRGGGCPFRSRTRKLTRDRSRQTIARPLGRAMLKPGARLEVRLTKPQTIGIVVRFTMRAGAFPARSELCLPPGAKRPKRCAA